jgi:catechol 2,3-dioxygenase-like lactoylglutathione lyase family enzyme
MAVLGVAITVGDIDRSVEFYRDVLNFVEEDRRELKGAELERVTGVFGAHVIIARMRLGNERIELWQYLAPEGRPMPVPSHANDRWFQHIAIVVSDMERAYRQVRAHKVRFASTDPQTLPQTLPHAAGISAFYFKDPDGHFLELINFPPGKGDPRWQTTGGLFLGIDHTAIAVSSTAASLKFYEGVLGMKLAGQGENFGTEQEHLNNVEGAHLRITTMKASSGPGIEFLEYLAPRDGEPAPRDGAANDLWHWHAIVQLGGGAQYARVLGHAGMSMFSSKSALDGPTLVKDPDGHGLMLVTGESDGAAVEDAPPGR